MGRRATESGEPLSIRLKSSLVEELTAAGKELELSLHDTIRQCLKIGLEDLRRIDYDLASVVVDGAALTKPAVQRGRKSPGLAELEVPLKDYSAALISPETARVAESPENHPIAQTEKKPVSYRSLEQRKKNDRR